MELTVNIKDGDREFGVDMAGVALEDLASSLAMMAAFILAHHMAPLDTEALKNANGCH